MHPYAIPKADCRDRRSASLRIVAPHLHEVDLPTGPTSSSNQPHHWPPYKWPMVLVFFSYTAL
jgi:hypothetical protein